MNKVRSDARNERWMPDGDIEAGIASSQEIVDAALADGDGELRCQYRIDAERMCSVNHSDMVCPFGRWPSVCAQAAKGHLDYYTAVRRARAELRRLAEAARSEAYRALADTP